MKKLLVRCQMLTQLFQTIVVHTRMIDIVSNRGEKQGQFFSIGKSVIEFWQQRQGVRGLNDIQAMQIVVVGHLRGRLIFLFNCCQKIE